MHAVCTSAGIVYSSCWLEYDARYTAHIACMLSHRLAQGLGSLHKQTPATMCQWQLYHAVFGLLVKLNLCHTDKAQQRRARPAAVAITESAEPVDARLCAKPEACPTCPTSKAHLQGNSNQHQGILLAAWHAITACITLSVMPLHLLCTGLEQLTAQRTQKPTIPATATCKPPTLAGFNQSTTHCMHTGPCNEQVQAP